MKLAAIYTKMRTLKKRREVLRLEYENKLADLEREIAEEQKAIDRIEEALAPLLCPVCDGSGNERYCDAAGDMDDRPCSMCKGTGIRPDTGE